MNSLKERIYYLNEKLSKQQANSNLSVYLNFYVTVSGEQTQSEKNAYFSFFCNGGKVKIAPVSESESGKEIKIFIHSVPVILGEYFSLDEGKKTVKVTTNCQAGTKLIFAVYGQVRYLDEMIIKSVNFTDASFIFSSCDGELKLYKYDGESLVLIENLGESPSGDICKGDLLYICYVSGEEVKVKIYYQDLSCVELSTEIEGQDVKIDYQEKLRLYVVKKGVLSSYEYENGVFTKTSLKKNVSKIYAIKGSKAVFRDGDGKIRLCFNLFE